MKIVFNIIALTLILGACVPTSGGRALRQNYRDPATWVDKTEQQLYARWGTPVAKYPVDVDTNIVTFIDSKLEPVYDDPNVYSYAEVPSYSWPVEQGIYYCKTSFVIKNGIVIDYNTVGEDCME